jgi:predicted metalloprotease with PDZ domain
LHEFAKNVYLVEAKDAEGESLPVSRPDPHTWLISGHEGEVHLSYVLFADRADGTYAQINETHAHLNIPATFMYARDYAQWPVEVEFVPREDLGWKVATQLKPLGDNRFYAPDLHYFMDSPTELSDFRMESFVVQENGKEKTIRAVLHSEGPDIDLKQFVEERVKPIVQQQQAVFGELPDFDFDTYTFLYCVGPEVSGDGMEHRNSTVITDTWREGRSWGEWRGGTTSHEFFHCWNVERIRPLSLEPFDYEEANMSGELWLAEGFTSYYTGLTLCRAGIYSQEDYVEGLAGSLNYVWNSPGRQYHNVIEMSYQAPFVDAATSVDPTNRGNTFISYYTYGSVLGLALDLRLRKEGLDLDGYMRLLWEKYGKPEIPYTISELENTLEEFAGQDLGNAFFEDYIYSPGMPDYKSLFAQAGIGFGPADPDRALLGLYLEEKEDAWVISRNPARGSVGEKANLKEGDRIVAIQGKNRSEVSQIAGLLSDYVPGDRITLGVERRGVRREVDYELSPSRNYRTFLLEDEGSELSEEQKTFREAWLGEK